MKHIWCLNTIVRNAQHKLEKSIFYLCAVFLCHRAYTSMPEGTQGCLLELFCTLPEITHLCTSKMIFDYSFWSLPSCTLRRLYWSLCCWICDTCCVTVAWSCSFWDVKVLIRCFSSSSSWSCERRKGTYSNNSFEYNTVRKANEDRKTWTPPLHTTG